MCGIAGILDSSASTSEDEVRRRVREMAETLAHRGPDDAEEWVDAEVGVGLAFRRLAIIDLTSTGRQPMVSASGRYVLVFNGELYNHRALRGELEALGTSFRGRSDTEVLVEAIAAWGPHRALERSNGMFALACWDRDQRVLSLARDRFGEKPLYYGWFGSSLVFGSELKALRAHPSFNADVDRDSLALYFRHAYVPAPWSIYSGVAKVPSASVITVDPAQPGAHSTRPYWSAVDEALKSAGSPRLTDPLEAADAVEEALMTSVGLRMVADVPVGAFLSGGTDSSLIVALMQAQTSGSARTYTIGFDVDGYDEAARAREIARHLGTRHTELYFTPAEVQAVIPRLPVVYDEPFADSSQMPTLLVATLARRDVTVALSGDGGDELFGGYSRYRALGRLQGLMQVPRIARLPASAAIRSLSAAGWDRVARVARGRRAPAQAGDKIRKFGTTLAGRSAETVYRSVVECWSGEVVLSPREPATVLAPAANWPVPSTEWAMLADTVTYLPDDLLVKVDRAAMAVSLETRVPMLDPDVYRLAWSLPPGQRAAGGNGKQVLLDVLRRHVPSSLSGGPKMGFGVPFGDWLRGPLRGWAEDLLDRDRLAHEGFLDVNVVQRCWREHLSGGHDHRHRLWAVLMFEAWLEAQS